MERKCVKGLGPIEGKRVKVLILGSFAGAMARKKKQSYANPHNAFWRIMGDLLNGGKVPDRYQARKALLKKHAIGLWDVVDECSIVGSQDISIVPRKLNRIPRMVKAHPELKAIFLNGHKAEKLFHENFSFPGTHVEYLPQTSPAHAAMSYRRKLNAWKKILKYI
ncbi:MAG: DNA-deoxyinosine glycosylase [Deltaproteobacteria bacterium]